MREILQQVADEEIEGCAEDGMMKIIQICSLRLKKKRGEIVRCEKKVTEVAATASGMKIKMRIRKAGRAKRLTERRIGVTTVPSPSFFLCQVIFLSSPFPSSFAAEKTRSLFVGRALSS